MSRNVARLREVVEPVVQTAGFDLEDITVTPVGKRRVLRVVVDSDTGVSLDDVAELSRVTSGALDRSDVMGDGPYVLEVTSPGVDRPLTEVRHWRRATGRLVRAGLRTGGSVTGRVIDADEQRVVLRTDGGDRELSYGDLGRGTVQVEFAHSEGREA